MTDLYCQNLYPRWSKFLDLEYSKYRTGPSWSKNGKDPSCSNDNHYLIDRCWQNKPGYLVDGHAAVSFLEYWLVIGLHSLG